MTEQTQEREWVDVKTLDPTDSIRVLVYHPDLMHSDWNPEGIAEGVLFPEHHGMRDAECAFWNGHQDTFYGNLVENVQTVMVLPKGPNS